MIDCSVILCCYNGKARIHPTVEHLAKQQVLPSLSWEFILVDNASTDGTAEYVQSIWDNLKPSAPLRVVKETRPGLVYARIAGVRAAKGKYIIFCDDDNWLRSDYIQTAYDIMENMPNVGVLGGQSVLAPGITPPIWWEEQQGNYAVGQQLSQSGLANARGFIYGAGMVTRAALARTIFDEQCPFLLTGRKGNQTLSGEDWEFCQRAMITGYDLYYNDRLFYWHDINPSRLTEEQLAKLLHSFELSSYIQEKYEYAQTFYKSGWLHNLMWLLVRVGNYFISRKHTRARKKQLLQMHLSMCGLYKDKDFEIIKRYIKLFGRKAV